MMLRALWAAPVRNVLLLLATAVFLVIAVTAYGQIRLNQLEQALLRCFVAPRLRNSWCSWAYSPSSQERCSPLTWRSAGSPRC
jgi:hypothetical protein